MADATKAPAFCATMNGSTFDQGKPRKAAAAIVTAVLRCPPDTPPDTYTAMVTARPQPMLIERYWPLLPPPRFTCATTATPNRMSTRVPRNSASTSRLVVGTRTLHVRVRVQGSGARG